MERINYNSLPIEHLQIIEKCYNDLLFKMLAIDRYEIARQINIELSIINNLIRQALYDNLK